METAPNWKSPREVTRLVAISFLVNRNYFGAERADQECRQL